jgi:hypothetical protein
LFGPSQKGTICNSVHNSMAKVYSKRIVGIQVHEYNAQSGYPYLQ